MSLDSPIYVGFEDGTSHHTWNLASTAWVIYSPTRKKIKLGGICLGLATNNVIEYNEII